MSYPSPVYILSPLSIKNDEKPKVDIFDGHNALDVAIRINKNFLCRSR